MIIFLQRNLNEKQNFDFKKFILYILNEKETSFKNPNNQFIFDKNNPISFSQEIETIIKNTKGILMNLKTIDQILKDEVFKFTDFLENLNYQFKFFESNFYNIFIKTQR